jgi:hypothetical protein
VEGAGVCNKLKLRWHTSASGPLGYRKRPRSSSGARDGGDAGLEAVVDRMGPLGRYVFDVLHDLLLRRCVHVLSTSRIASIFDGQAPACVARC